MRIGSLWSGVLKRNITNMFINEHLDIENRASWKQMGRVWKHVSKGASWHRKTCILASKNLHLRSIWGEFLKTRRGQHVFKEASWHRKHTSWKNMGGSLETRRGQHVSKKASCHRKTYILEAYGGEIKNAARPTRF